MFSFLQNSFELILITDGLRTYAIYVYECQQLQWSASQQNDFPTIGFNINPISAFGSDLRTFLEHPFSNTPIAHQIACSNINKGSLYYSEAFLVGNATDPLDLARAECQNHVDNDIYYELFLDNSTITERCPCTWFQAQRDFAFRFVDLHDITRDDVYRNLRCYTNRFGQNDVLQCCYR